MPIRTPIRVVGAAILVVAALLTTACAPASESSAAPAPPSTPVVSADGTQKVTVAVGNGMRFDPSSIVVEAGKPIEVTLVNESAIPHDFALASGPTQPVRIAATGGQSAKGTFTIEKPGTYTFICSVPGHEAAGMKGTITAR